MKKPIITTLIIVLLSAIAYAGGDDKLTLKEKVEQAKEVKVFFDVRDIVDQAAERKLQLLNPDAKTDIRTKMPEGFYDSEIKLNVLKFLNEGLNVGSAFVEADISVLPQVNNSKFQYRDLSKLPDGLYAIITIEGEYSRFLETKQVENKMVEVATNGMEITSHIYFYEVIAGEVSKYGDMMMKSGVLLGNAKSAIVKSGKLENLEYMEANFPALPLLAEFKATMYRFTQDFAARQLKKHEKEIAKRK